MHRAPQFMCRAREAQKVFFLSPLSSSHNTIHVTFIYSYREENNNNNYDYYNRHRHWSEILFVCIMHRICSLMRTRWAFHNDNNNNAYAWCYMATRRECNHVKRALNFLSWRSHMIWLISQQHSTHDTLHSKILVFAPSKRQTLDKATIKPLYRMWYEVWVNVIIQCEQFFVCLFEYYICKI